WYSMPLFWLALLLQIFAVKYAPWLPIQGQVTPGILSGRPWVVGSGVFDSTPTHFLILDAALNGDREIFWDALRHLILPALTLTYGFLGGILRMVRSGMVDAMNQEYGKTAWSKGLPESVVIRNHIRRNALLPVTTVVGLLPAGLGRTRVYLAIALAAQCRPDRDDELSHAYNRFPQAPWW